VQKTHPLYELRWLVGWRSNFILLHISEEHQLEDSCDADGYLPFTDDPNLIKKIPEKEMKTLTDFSNLAEQIPETEKTTDETSLKEDE